MSNDNGKRKVEMTGGRRNRRCIDVTSGGNQFCGEGDDVMMMRTTGAEEKRKTYPCVADGSKEDQVWVGLSRK